MMPDAKSQIKEFFVDEAGDPTFYDRTGNLIVGQPGCSTILLLGFIETTNAQSIREAVLKLQREVIADRFFQSFPSISKTATAFHAKDDIAEIRYLFFRLIASLDFRAQFIVARKKESLFRTKFHARESEFYDELVSRLFQNALHKSEYNRIYFAKRGSRDRQQPLLQAIETGIARFESRWSKNVNTRIDVQAQTPKGEPCLSVVDYMNWAVYRAFTRSEMHAYRLVEDKISLIVDLYDFDKYPRNWYSRRNHNPFEANKITPL
jgi:hypothetical protein